MARQTTGGISGRQRIALLTDSRTERWESLDAYGIYLIDAAAGGEPRKLLQREAILDVLHWSPDSRHILFLIPQRFSRREISGRPVASLLGGHSR